MKWFRGNDDQSLPERREDSKLKWRLADVRNF